MIAMTELFNNGNLVGYQVIEYPNPASGVFIVHYEIVGRAHDKQSITLARKEAEIFLNRFLQSRTKNVAKNVLSS